jgi:hypothetical protein
MADRKTFGRRSHFSATHQRRAEPARAAAAPPPSRPSAPSDVPSSHTLPPLREDEGLAHDAELAEWKKARRQAFKIPWRQLSLLASLFFGIASLALPDSVNENVNLLLYGLMAASFYAWISGRWRKAGR